LALRRTKLFMSATPSLIPAPHTDLIANVFDALPLPAFVVDHDFNIVDFNLAGVRLLDRVPYAVLRLRGAEQLQCIHSVETADGESSAPCQECVAKNFVRAVFGQSPAPRDTRRLWLTNAGKAEEVDFLITVAPIPDESEPLALLILDDAEELSALLSSKERAGRPASSSPDSKVRAKARGRKKDNS
jgi:hypothetical protein